MTDEATRSQWTKWCRRKGWPVIGDKVRIRLAGPRDGGAPRSHSVEVCSVPGGFELKSLASCARDTDGRSDIALELWIWNRSLDLVGVRRDDRGDVVAQAWIPCPGMDADEFTFVALHLAREADRLEFLLTANDAN